MVYSPGSTVDGLKFLPETPSPSNSPPNGKAVALKSIELALLHTTISSPAYTVSGSTTVIY